MRGLPRNAIATDSLRLWPPESSSERTSSFPMRSTSAAAVHAAAATSLCGMPRSAA